jgi:hypothetical protein
MWLLACWDCGFESRLGHGRLSLVSVLCCQVGVSATGWSLVQRSPTDCGVSKCDRKTSIMRTPWPTRGCCAMNVYIYIYIILKHRTIGTIGHTLPVSPFIIRSKVLICIVYSTNDISIRMLRSALVWDIKQRRVVHIYRRCVVSHKRADVISIAAEIWSDGYQNVIFIIS